MPGPRLCHYRPCIFCPVGRGLDPSAASRRRALAPTKKSPPSGCGSGWGLGVSVCVRRNHVPELRLRLRNPVPIYYRITAKKLCFSYEQFVNYRAAGPNAPAASFFVCIWKRCKGSWRERGNCREVGAGHARPLRRSKIKTGSHPFCVTARLAYNQITLYSFSSFSTSVPSIFLRASFMASLPTRGISISVILRPSRSLTVASSRQRMS